MYNKPMGLKPSKKIDTKFVLISAIALVAMLFLSLGFDSEVHYEQKELPQDYETGFSKLVINELVTKNKGVYANKHNEVCDYLELYNATSSPINLKGYGLSDDTTQIKWTFPDVTIPANGYLVVALSGKSEATSLIANFKLSSSKSERVILTNQAAKVIDAVDTVSLGENQCMARDEQGNWFVCDYCTPGFENSLEGLNDYHDSIMISDETDALCINEFLPRNKGNYFSENADDTGFIEFKNISDKTITLSDYCISNDPYVPFKKQLPDIRLAPNEIYTLKLGNGNYYEEGYLGINLNGKNGSVLLCKNGTIVTQLDYENLNNGNAYFYDLGHYYISSVVSPNYENDISGITTFQKENMQVPGGLIISEAMNDNYSYLAQNGNNYYDWVELYNNSDETVYLGNYTISNTDTKLDLYQLPDMYLEPFHYIVLMCSGDTNLTNASFYHTNFKLSEDTGLYLSKQGKLVDCMHLANLPKGHSIGRNGSEGVFYMTSPTPGSANNGGYRVVSQKPMVMLQGGVYNDVTTLNVQIEGMGDIHYTLDGSEPTLNSARYTEPLTFSKTCVLKTKAFNDGMISSETTTDSYIVNENHAVPVISISLDSADFNSINRNYYWYDYNKQAYVEFFDGDEGFESFCGVSVYGDESRQGVKKNYALHFDKEFGTGNLHYRVFEDRDNAEYDTLALRAGSQDWRKAILTDTLCTSMIDDCTDVDTYASRTVIAYINGQYWGLYTLKEKKNASYFEENYNLPKEGFKLIQSSYEVNFGDCSSFIALSNYCHTHDLAVDEYYDYVCTQIDIENWADFWIGQMYCANIDYFNIRYFSHPDLDDGKWKCVFYDLDFAFYENSYNSYTRGLCRSGGFYCYWFNEEGFQDRIDNIIIRSLLRNKRFQEYWFERLNYNLRTTWNQERFMERLNELVAEYEPEIYRDRSRWGLSVSTWYSCIANIRSFINSRTYYVLRTTKSYFGLSDARMKELFGDLYG